MPGNSQTRQQSLRRTEPVSSSPEPQMSRPDSSPVSEPAYSTPELMSHLPDPVASGAGNELPMCSIPGHEDRAVLEPMTQTQPELTSPQPEVNQLANMSRQGIVERGQSALTQPASAGVGEVLVSTNGDDAVMLENQYRTRNPFQQLRRRTDNEDQSESQPTSEPELVIPELRLQALAVERPQPLASINLPSALVAAPKPSSNLNTIAEADGDKRRAAAEARSYADQRYAEVVRHAQFIASHHAQQTLGAARRIASETSHKVDDLTLGAQQADAEIESSMTTADVGLLAFAHERKQQLNNEFRDAMLGLRRANAIAHGAANSANRVSQNHIGGLLTSHAGAYTSLVSRAILEISSAGATALEKITDFRRKATRPDLFEGQHHSSDARRKIQREVNKAAGEPLARMARGKINQALNGDANSGGFSPAPAPVPAHTSASAAQSSVTNASMPQEASNPADSGGLLGQLATKSQADQVLFHERLRPVLEGTLNQTRESVNSTLSKTFRRTSQMLREQRDNAIETIDREVRAARAQLGVQRQLARDTLKTQADSVIGQVVSRAESARDGMEKATRGTRPHTELALEKLQGSIVGVGLSPPEQLRKTAEIATKQVAGSLSGAGDMQRKQTDVIEASTVEGLTQDTNQAITVRREHTAGELERIGQAELATTTSVARTLQTTTENFASAISTMTEAGQSSAVQYKRTRDSATSIEQQQRDEDLRAYENNLLATEAQFLEFSDPFRKPEEEQTIKAALREGFDNANAKAESATEDVAGAFDRIRATVFSSGSEQVDALKAVRGFTRGKGDRFKEHWNTSTNGFLQLRIQKLLSYNNRHAFRSYLLGNNVEAAAYELEDSTGWINDDEARMEAVLRALNPDQLKTLDEADSDSRIGEMRDHARDVLGGVDANVFDALRKGNYARADAYRFQEAQQNNIRNRNADAAHKTIGEYVSAPAAGSWGQNPTATAAQRRQRIADELANIRNPRQATSTTNLDEDQQQANLQAMADFATGTYTFSNPYRPQDGEQTRTTWSGANHDLVRDLVLHGQGSREARAAAIGVEAERRRGGPNIENLDTALYYSELDPNTHPPDFVVPAEVLTRVQAERDAALIEANSRYGVAGQSTLTEDADAAKLGIIDRLTQRLGPDKVRTSLITGMVNDDVPSPDTAARAMEYAVRGNGTKEPIIWRFVGRMSQEEIRRMNIRYKANTGESLYERLGLYNNDAGELSGSDRLRANRMFRGLARTDQEKAEAAIYAIRQQEIETGGVGAALAERSMTNRMMEANLAELEQISGGTVEFDDETGAAQWSGNKNFDDDGAFTGSANDRTEFVASLASSNQSAKSYQALIDHYASQASLAITVLGVIAAAVVTVATAGAAGPLLMAAIAASAGVAGMAAKEAIRGGGYGWEEAAVDMGMTAVDMLTAGVGQGLGLASRGGMNAARQGMRNGLSIAAAKSLNKTLTREAAEGVGRRAILSNADNVASGAVLTGSELGDKLAISAITGGAGGFGQSLLDERTYDENARGGVVGNLLMGTLQGAGVASVTASVSHGFERIPINRAGDTLESLSNRGALTQGLIEGLSSGAGSFAGTGTQLGIDKMRGRFNGDLGDALSTMSSEAMQNFAQGMYEGHGNSRRESAERSARNHVESTSADTVGTAAAIAESTMRGDFLDRPRLAGTTRNAAKSLANDPPTSVGPMRRLDNVAYNETRFVIGGSAVDEPETNIRVRQVDTLSPVDGEVPVARFRREPNEHGVFEYIVEVSGLAHQDMVQRALAHEVAEIRSIERRRASGIDVDAKTPDRLRPAATAPDTDAPAREALSPHDHGRLAEMEVLSRQLANPDLDDGKRALLQDEAQRLADHLGLVGDTPQAAARRQLAMDAAIDLPGVPDFIKLVSAEAQNNPFLKPLKGTVEHVMGILADRWTLAEKIDRGLGVKQIGANSHSEAIRRHGFGQAPRDVQNFTPRKDIVLRQAGRVAVQGGIVSLQPRKKHSNYTIHGLVQRRVLSLVPHAENLLRTVRSRLGDSDYQAQVRGTAEDRFRATFENGRSPAEMADAQLESARVLSPHALDNAKLSDLVGTDPVTVGRLLETRDGLLDQRQALVLKHQSAIGSDATDLTDQLNTLNSRLNKIAEVLGEVAGRRVVEQRNEDLHEAARLEEVHFPGSGSGLPDLVYRNQTGRDPALLIIEAKGGDSMLGTRESVDKTRRVEQGTFEYLRSLANSMTRGTKPKEVQDLGQEILRLLNDSPDQIEYQLVQQRLPESGQSLPPPEVGTFDLKPKSTISRGTADRTAAAVPGSNRFRGDHQAIAVDPVQMQQQLQRAAQKLGGRQEGVGSFIRTADAGEPGDLVRFRLNIGAQASGKDLSVAVRSRSAGDMHKSEKGESSVAKYELQSDGNYVIYVSDQASPQVYERALAHEIAEISRLPASGTANEKLRQLERSGTDVDMLVQGNTSRLAMNEDSTPHLSPHDEGRIAELEIIARDIIDDNNGAAAREELRHLARHLGLHETGPAADARRQVVYDRLSESGIDFKQLRRLVDIADFLAVPSFRNLLQAIEGINPTEHSVQLLNVDTVNLNGQLEINAVLLSSMSDTEVTELMSATLDLSKHNGVAKKTSNVTKKTLELFRKSRGPAHRLRFEPDLLKADKFFDDIFIQLGLENTKIVKGLFAQKSVTDRARLFDIVNESVPTGASNLNMQAVDYALKRNPNSVGDFVNRVQMYKADLKRAVEKLIIESRSEIEKKIKKLPQLPSNPKEADIILTKIYLEVSKSMLGGGEVRSHSDSSKSLRKAAYETIQKRFGDDADQKQASSTALMQIIQTYVEKRSALGGRSGAVRHVATNLAAKELGGAIQKLEDLEFSSESSAIYHQHKHYTELPPIERTGANEMTNYLLSAQKTIRLGEASEAKPMQFGGYSIIFKRTVTDGTDKYTLSAIIHTASDGATKLASYGGSKQEINEEKE